MQFPAIQQLLNNYQTAEQDGRFNVDVSVLHAPVGITVTYPNHNRQPATIDTQYFYPNEPHGSFPQPISLKKGDQFCFWALLIPQVVQNGFSQVVKFGVGAQEKGPGLYGEVVEITVSPTPSSPSPKTPLGKMPPLGSPGRNWQANISDAAINAPDDYWSISVTHNGNSYDQQSGSVVFLASTDGHYYHSWAKGQSDAFVLNREDANSRKFYLCVLLKGTPQSDGTLVFQVGDPEKDAKARMVGV